MRFLPVPCILLLAVAAAARADQAALDAVLDAQRDRAASRPRVVAYAESIAARDPAMAALALDAAGTGFARDGEPDSAVACFERALALEPVPPRRITLAAALIARLGGGDAARARAVLRPILSITPQLPDPTQAPQQGWYAWGHYLSGHADSAATLFAPIDSWLSPQPEWRYRLGCVAFDRAEWIRVMQLLTPLAVRSRMADRDVMELLDRASDQLGAQRRLKPMLMHEVVDRDKIEDELLTDLRARRVGYTAADGFPLSGTLVVPPRATRPRSAVVLMAPGDTIASYDSLASGLARLGFAVLLTELRGSGRSVAPGCPSPESWRGRETRMEALVAGDVRRALLALAREAKADTTRYLVVGVGESGPIAIEAAARDRRIPALLLVSPVAPPIERGPLRAILARLKRPVYFQTGPEDFTTWGLIETLYQACDPRASRVADSDKPGHLATLFRRDPMVLARFKQWLAETWPAAKPAPRATPPSSPRPG